MGTGFAKKKKQAREFQTQMAKIQEQMASMEVVGTAGNGLVTVTLNGHREVRSVKINPECVDKEDIEGLEDLVKAAFNEAFKKLDEQTPDLNNLGSFGAGFGSGLSNLLK